MSVFSFKKVFISYLLLTELSPRRNIMKKNDAKLRAKVKELVCPIDKISFGL